MIDVIHHSGRRLLLGIALIMCTVFVPAAVFAADVDVYAEGAYTETDLVLFIYADITPQILSYGVKITYETSALTLTGAEKNEAVWFMGDGTADGNHAYMDPDTTTPGEVIIIGGKLDTAAPTQGVTGNRVLLGTVTFDRTSSTMPFSPTLSLDYARGGSFANFVQTDNTVLDGSGVSFAINVNERGDANGDGAINVGDYIAIRNNISSTSFPPWMDCNGDGAVNVGDYICVRNKM